MTATVTSDWTRAAGADGTVALVAQRCADCGQLTFPPTAERCPNCWSESLSPEEVPTAGTLYSFTTVRRSFPGREVPYVVGLVDLDAGLRVMATVVADGEEEIAVGRRVKGFASGGERDGLPATAYEFRPA